MRNLKTMKSNLTPFIPIEEACDAAFEKIGGVRVDSIIAASPKLTGADGTPNFSNADYLFQSDGVIAELKNLEEDPMKGPAFKEKVAKLIDRWANEGKSLVYGDILDTSKLPEECAQEFYGLLRSPFENSVLKKANKQIRETKVALNLPNAKGLLLLANEGNLTFDPGVTFYLLDHALRGQYSNIDHVIFFTANLKMDLPWIARNVYMWADVRFKSRKRIDDAFLDRLKSAWIAEVQERVGKKVPFVHTNMSPDEIRLMRFQKP